MERITRVRSQPYTKATMMERMKVPVKKKGGSFVIEAHFVKEIAPGFARPA